MYKYQSALLESYNRATFKSVRQAYGKPSTRKCNAENHILGEMVALNGYDYRVTSKNTFSFSCGFRYTNKNDNKEHLVYHTSCKQYDFCIE